MRLMNRQLVKELLKNKIFLFLLLILTGFTSFLYFFVHFSVDANLVWLGERSDLNEEQLLFQNGLESNAILAQNLLIAFVLLTAFAFALFFYRFFQKNSRSLGCLKALGFTDRMLESVFLKAAAALSMTGALAGFTAGRFASGILIAASRQSYRVEGVVKGISWQSALTGLFFPGVVFCLITRFAFGSIRGKEAGNLIRGVRRKAADTVSFRLADRISRIFPVKRRLAVRLALRNLTSVFLILISVMIVSVMFLLGYSLHESSRKLRDSQMTGHHYQYETFWEMPRRIQDLPKGSIRYLTAEAELSGRSESVDWTLAGVEGDEAVFELLDRRGEPVAFPKKGEMIIGADLEELYGFRKGDCAEVTVAGRQFEMRIVQTAFNAKTGWAYVSREDLGEMLSLQPDACTGVFGMTEPLWEEGTVITRAQKLDALERGMVSNRVSAVINQVIGCAVGCILLFLAMLLNFQSGARDVNILRLLGYRRKEIRTMLLDIYRPLLWGIFVLTLIPARQVTRLILRTLSLQIGDFMMFETNFAVALAVFLVLNLLYSAVLSVFCRRV